MAINDNAIQELIGAIAPDAQQKKSSTYAATVSRIDGEGTVWVNIAGSEKETPTSTTSAEVKAGDAVNVEWRNNKLYIAGNISNPSAGVQTVARVDRRAIEAQNRATAAQNVAESASRIAGNTNQYFWHTETGTDTGAHITEVPRDEFLEDPTQGGGNLLARSNGIAVRDGMTELASFGASAIQIGQTNDTRLTLTTSGLSIDGYGIQDTPVQFMFLGDSELKANANFNINIGHGVSSKTDTYLTTDRVHMDFAHTSLKFDGSSNAVNDPVIVSTEDFDNGIQFNSAVTVNANFNSSQPIKVNNYKIITTQLFNADNISITANGYAEGSISITKAGYTPIGVLDTYVNNASSSGSGSSFAAIYRTYHSGNTYYYGLRNVTNSAIKVRVYAKILYVATSQGI